VGALTNTTYSIIQLEQQRMINVIKFKTKYTQRKRVTKHRREKLSESSGIGHFVEDTSG